MSVLIGALIGIIPELIILRISFIKKNIKTGDPLRFAIKNLQSTFVAVEVQNDKSKSCAVQKKLQNAGSELARFITHFFSSQKNPKHLNENSGQLSLTTCKTLDGAVLTR